MPVSVVSDGAIRLVGGFGEYDGRLEIFHSEWGLVGDKGNDSIDVATTACRQLGYT